MTPREFPAVRGPRANYNQAHDWRGLEQDSRSLSFALIL